MFMSEEQETPQNEASASSPSSTANPGMRWYVVQAYSGYEAKVKRQIEESARQQGLADMIGEILIPQESAEGKEKKKKSARNFYPGYMFIQMVLNERTWHLVKDTPKVNGFVGGMHPTPISENEIASISQQMAEGAAKPRPRVAYQQGDYVRVTSGAFANFAGTIEEVKPEKQKVRVLVSIFGRSTPVELNYNEVEKAV